MSSDTLAGLVFATGFWIIAACALAWGPNEPKGHIWTLTSSDQIPSRPMLVRAAYPRAVASRGAGPIVAMQ